MRLPLSWLAEDAGLARRPGSRRRGPAADRGRPGGRGGRGRRAGHQRRAGGRGDRHRGTDRVQEADPVLPGQSPAAASRAGSICGAVNFAAGDRVPLALPGAHLPGGFEISARKTYGHISDGMICSVRRARHRRGSLRHPGAAAGRAAGRRLRGLRRPGRPCAGHRGHPGPGLRAVRPRRGPGTGHLLRRADPRPGRRGPAGRCRGGVPGRLPGQHRGPHRVRPVRAARGARVRPGGAHPAVDAGPAGPVRHAVGVAGRGHHQLPDAGARPAAARVRPGQAERAHRGPPGPGRGAAGNARPRGPRPGPRGHRSSPTPPARSRWPAPWAALATEISEHVQQPGHRGGALRRRAARPG